LEAAKRGAAEGEPIAFWVLIACWLAAASQAAANAYYVHDGVVGESGSLCTGAGGDADGGLTPTMRQRYRRVLSDSRRAVGSGSMLSGDLGARRETA